MGCPRRRSSDPKSRVFEHRSAPVPDERGLRRPDLTFGFPLPVDRCHAAQRDGALARPLAHARQCGRLGGHFELLGELSPVPRWISSPRAAHKRREKCVGHSPERTEPIEEFRPERLVVETLGCELRHDIGARLGIGPDPVEDGTVRKLSKNARGKSYGEQMGCNRFL